MIFFLPKKYLYFIIGIVTIGGFLILATVQIYKFTGLQVTSQPAQDYILSSDPRPGAQEVPLYQKVTVNLNILLKHAFIEIPGVPGRSFLKNQQVIFQPDNAFLPDTTYTVFVRTVPDDLRLGPIQIFTFRTQDIGNQVWVEVKLGKIHTVTVYKGQYPVKNMIASGGLAQSKTPLGTFYIGDRGERFWSEKFGEGATYWVRFQDNYLFHSVPKNADWQTKTEEHEKLGLPSSHGCIRLNEIDAVWFYHNIPRGAMVIIHE